MELDKRLENVTVIGAAGKMGSGIALLLAQEMARACLQPENKGRLFRLNLLDVSDAALAGLMGYLRTQLVKAGEKSAVLLRDLYRDREDLVENAEIIEAYVQEALALCRCGTDPATAAGSRMVFEAIVESAEVKVEVLGRMKGIAAPDAWFFTNTSSIPIHLLDERIGLGGRIIGFHFYNPPAVQKLVELIRSETTLPELADFAGQYAKKLRKTVVPSRDVAGFIGNGHFMRDALHAVAEVGRLSPEFGFADAVYMINKVSQDLLIRPMGIFQLIDYVGIDVCQSILRVMDERLPGAGLRSPLIDTLAGLGVKGGQNADGSQKDGFLKYEKGRPAAVFDPGAKAYVAFAEIGPRSDQRLGPAPASAKPWKNVIQVADRAAYLDGYFRELGAMDTLGAGLAKAYGLRSKEIGLGLVRDGVAGRDEDVNTVLLTGFYHSYGPVNNYFDAGGRT